MRLLRFILNAIYGVVISSGLIFLFLLALCFTPYPWRAYSSLSKDAHGLASPPDVLVMMGAGGIPGKDDFMRSYALAAAARQYPNALVAVAITDTNDPAVVRLKDELVMRGIKPERILWEDQGRNTREQALRMHDLLYADGMEPGVLLITSPSHLKRSLLAFRKAGFHDIAGQTEVATSLQSDLSYQPAQLGGDTTQPIAAIGRLPFFRYEIWNNLAYLLGYAQETTALAYYRAMGWI